MTTKTLLSQFADQYRLKISTQSSEQIISGRYGHVFEYDDRCLGALFTTKANSRHKWAHAKRRLLNVGVRLRQNGDAEGIVLFDPENALQASLVIEIVAIKVKRERSPAQRAQFEKLRQFRFGTRAGTKT